MIKCFNCGEENRPGAIFCKACGGRLLAPELLNDEEQKRLNISKTRITKTSTHHKKIFQIAVPLAIFFTLCYLIVQHLETPNTLKNEERYAKKFEAKLFRLQENYNNTKKYRIAVTEEELNSFIRKYVVFDENQSINFFLDDGLLIFLSKKLLGKQITLRIYSGLLVNEQKFNIDILNVKIGKLPIPSFLVEYLLNSVFLKKFDEEIYCPPYITNFEFSENLMYISYDPYSQTDQSAQSSSFDSSSLTDKEQVDRLLMNANTFYKNKEYERAIIIYEKIISNYPSDSRVPTIKKMVR